MHFWIIEVNDKSERWKWSPVGTGRGALDIVAYRTKKEAKPELHEKAQIYGKSRLTKYVSIRERAE